MSLCNDDFTKLPFNIGAMDFAELTSILDAKAKKHREQMQAKMRK